MSTPEPPSVTAEPTADGLRIAQPVPEPEGSGATAVAPGDPYAPQPRLPGLVRHRVARRIGVYHLAAVLVGALSGLVWHHVVHLAAYRVNSDGTFGAATTERGLADFFASDGWFCLIGAVVGLLVGLLAWRWFRRLGWPVAVLSVTGAGLAAGCCWAVGVAMGPRHFDKRMAQAAQGNLVPIDFALRSWPALLVWPLFAVVPVLLFSIFAKDPEQERRPRARGRAAAGAVAADEAA